VITRFPHYDVGRTVMALEIACGGIEVNQWEKLKSHFLFRIIDSTTISSTTNVESVRFITCMYNNTTNRVFVKYWSENGPGFST
jgi:hypothetical protein